MKFDYDQLLAMTSKEFADEVRWAMDQQNEIREVMAYRVSVDRHGLTEDEVKLPEDAPIVVVDFMAGWQGAPLAHWTYWFDTHSKHFDFRVVNAEMVERFDALAADAEILPELGVYSFRKEG